MDRWGYWCNAHGRFEHKKISDYFHAAIARDKHGYFVSQENGEILEKVYFHYEDTALFVVAVMPGDNLTLVLNTRRQITLDPRALLICNDQLYLRKDDELIKFNESAMLRISRYLEHEGEKCFISIKGGRIPIPETHADTPSGGHPGQSDP
ncbi:MAG: MFS transporter permease [Desulfobacterales bacterium]